MRIPLILQASLVASRLQCEHFDLVYSSDLCRALKTAQTIVDKNDSFHDRILTDKLLRERHFGRFEDVDHREFMSAAREAGYTSGPDIWQTFAESTMETATDVTNRAETFIKVCYNSQLAVEQKPFSQIGTCAIYHFAFEKKLLTFYF